MANNMTNQTQRDHHANQENSNNVNLSHNNEAYKSVQDNRSGQLNRSGNSSGKK